jgi:hypothetical protein
MIEREILYRLVYLVFILPQISWLDNAKYWKVLKPILIMKNLYRPIESFVITHHVSGLSYYLYRHFNHFRTS